MQFHECHKILEPLVSNQYHCCAYKYILLCCCCCWCCCYCCWWCCCFVVVVVVVLLLFCCCCCCFFFVVVVVVVAAAVVAAATAGIDDDVVVVVIVVVSVVKFSYIVYHPDYLWVYVFTKHTKCRHLRYVQGIRVVSLVHALLQSCIHYCADIREHNSLRVREKMHESSQLIM